jgi:hypothetical protein
MNKTTLIAILVFGALVGAALLTKDKGEARGIRRISFADVATDAIDRVVIGGEKPAVLVKADGKWTADGKAGDQSAIDRLLEALPKVDSTNLVTSNAESYAASEVDDDKGVAVEAFAGAKSVAKLVVGKFSSGSVHVRVGEEVFSVKDLSRSSFVRTSWVELKLFEEKLEDIARVDVRVHGQAPFSLVPENDTWALADAAPLPPGFRFDGDAAKRLVNSLVGLRAREYVTVDAEKTGLGEEANSVAFTTKAGKTTALRIGKRDDEDQNHYAQVEGRTDVVTVAKFTVEGLLKSPTDFRDLKLMRFDADKVNALEIRDGKDVLKLTKKGTDWSVDSYSGRIPADFELDKSAVTRRLSSLGNTKGTEVAQGRVGRDGVTATLEDGSKAELRFGDESKHDDKEVYVAMGNADGATYYVAKYTRRNLLGMLDTFKKKDAVESDPFANLDPSTLANLPPDVRKSLVEQMDKKKKEQALLQQLQAQ